MRFPIFIELRRSHFFALALSLIHVLAGYCIISMSWSWSVRGLLLLFPALSFAGCLRKAQFVGLRIVNDKQLLCLTRDGACLACDILPGTTVWGRLIVVRLLLAGDSRPRSLVVLPDQLSFEQFRTLRLWLRWRRVTRASGARVS